MNSKLFVGTIRHRRHIIKQHQFKYSYFMHYFDLDELDEVFNDYWLWSTRNFNLGSFKRSKYLGDTSQPLIKSVQEFIHRNTKQHVDKVYLLTSLAYYGCCYNPLNIYFCYTENKLSYFILEVTNTPWGEQYHYLLQPQTIKQDVYTAKFSKKLHVSPFLTMDYEYHLRCKYNDQQIIAHIENYQADECHFDATLSLLAKPLTHRNSASLLVKFPFITGKVVTAIYWQALKLWLKGISFNSHPRNKHV